MSDARERSAVISACGRYRYRLERWWDTSRAPLVFVMLNPSTADALVDDPTIRRCIGFAKREGAGGLIVGNLFAWRATDPKALRSVDDPVGEGNNGHLIAMAQDGGGQIVAAWGAHGALFGRDRTVAKRLYEAGISARCLGLTAKGAPRHPLYIPTNQPLEYLW